MKKAATLQELTPNERNPRRMSDAQTSALRKSLLEFGPLDGFVFNRRSKRLVGGHQRKGILAGTSPIVILERFAKPNTQGTIACGYVQADNGERITYREVDWPEAKEKAAMLAANKHSGKWDEDALAQILAELETEGFDRELTGFEHKEIAQLLAKFEIDQDAKPQIGKADELRRKWKVERQQIWELGAHRLMCGDSTQSNDVLKLLGNNRPELMITDPPYGVEYDPSWREGHDLNMGKNLGLKGMSRSLGSVKNDERVDWTDAFALFSGDIAYVWHAGIFAERVSKNLKSSKFQIRAQIIWVKQHFVFGRGAYHWQHEPCWYAVREGANARWIGDRKQTTTWLIENNNPIGHHSEKEQKTGHGTQKPVECMAKAIRNHSGDVYEPFCGSGTTIIACEQLGRKCRAMEIDPGYVAVAIQRWADATGKKPKLAENGA
jgi:DNA modification methylase